MKTVQNSEGQIYYGMHFYPGVAQYDEPGKETLRVFINEDTIRKIGPTFAGKPIFVEHVEEVEESVDELRNEADGWVIESFFNEADGKHWVKFILVSTKAQRAVENGWRLSNAYHPQLSAKGGTWNGVPYQQEVVGGEYEHLAIVKNPRYEESVIMSPDEFKAYNDELKVELKRIANSKKETTKMSKLKFWNRKPAENAADLEGLSVTLPKSGKELTIVQLVNAMDAVEEAKKENAADPKAMVKLHDGTVCNVGELVEKYKAISEEKKNETMSETELDPEKVPVEVEGDLANEDEVEAEAEDVVENADEAPEDKKAKEAKVANSKQAAKSAKKETPTEKARREHFESLKNAREEIEKSATPKYASMKNGVERGKSKYGSANA